jgi:hypothetical protein
MANPDKSMKTHIGIEVVAKLAENVCVVPAATGHETVVETKRWPRYIVQSDSHSYGTSGTPSTIHGLGRIIAAIAELQVPQHPGPPTVSASLNVIPVSTLSPCNSLA